MRQYKFCPDKQKYNNAKPFPVYVVATEEIENYYEYSKYGHCMNPEHVPDVFASECSIYIALHYLLKDRYAYEFSPYSSKLTTLEDLVSSSVFIIT